MATVPAGHNVDWYRVPLPAGRLDELNRRSDLLGLAQSLGYLAVVTATGGTAVWAAINQSWWLLAVALIAHGNVSAFMINGVHELVHGTVFRSRWLNGLFVHLFAFIGWINHRMFWASHAEHHLHTMHFPYDQENVFPIRYRFRDFLREATINPLGLRWLIAHHWRIGRGQLVGDWEKHLLEGQPRRAAIAAWSRWILIGHAAIAGVSLAYGLWIIPVVVSLTPLYCKGVFWLLNNAQHVGLVESVPDFRLNCRTIIVNPVFRFLYWHMNWHIEHHMYAAVPCYRLGALHRAIAHELPHCPRGLIETWWHIIGVMWRQQQEPGWAFRPQLPGEAKAAEATTVAAEAQVQAPAKAQPRKVWQCAVCGMIYDEQRGRPSEDIPPGTAWADVPETWRCPACGVGKADFRMIEITPGVRPPRPAKAA